MVLSDIIISRTSLIILAFLLILTIVNIFVMYLIKKKMKQKVMETPEYKKSLAKLEKLKTVNITAKSEKIVKVKRTGIFAGKVQEEDDKATSFKLLKGKSKWSWDYWKTWYIDKYHPGKAVLINMELTNGFHRLFTIKEKEEGFVFRGKKYLFDDDSKYYNMDTKLYTFDYHEQIALPFKRKIPVTEIKKTIESTEGIDVEYAINPSTLQRFMTAKIAEGVMKGTQLDEFMKKLQTFLIVTMVAVLAHFALFLYASGILQNLKVPGILG